MIALADPTLLDCLETTATEWGSSRASEFRRCQEAHRLRYHQLIQPSWRVRSDEAGPAYFGVGGLLHSGLAYLHRGGNPDTLFAYCMQRDGEHDLGHVVEAQRLWHWYQEHYDVSPLDDPGTVPDATRCGWADGCEVLAVEQFAEATDIFAIPETRRFDLVMQIGSEIIVVDHKTRASKVPGAGSRRTPPDPAKRDEYIRGLTTRPAILGQSWLAQRAYGCEAPCPVMLNVIVKTKVPSFERVLVRPTQNQVDRWLDVRKIEAEAQASAWAMPNYDQCAPEIGSRCSYFQWCHGSSEERERHFVKVEA